MPKTSMDTNMSLFNQINSLCYWFQHETNYNCSIVLDSEKDTYFIKLKSRGSHIYAHQITGFSKKSKRLLQIELSSVANSLVYIKDKYALKRQRV